jgi:hypothetical protein
MIIYDRDRKEFELSGRRVHGESCIKGKGLPRETLVLQPEQHGC